jgi:hypothetical protein
VDHQEVFFPSYATDFIAPISNPNLTQYVRLRVLNLDEPSAVLRDHQNDQWIFRVTQIDLAHSQPKMDVLARVQEDERNAEAQRMALADANKLLEEAQKVGLRGAATQPSMVVRTTGLFGSSDATAAALVPYQLPNEQACRSFVGQALNLLLTPSPNDPQHPVMAINLPEAHRADVVQLNELKPMWNTRTLGLEEYMAGFEELSQRKFGDPQTTVPVPFATQWFSYDAVTARLGYVPAPVDKNAPNQPQPPQNLPSQNPF